MNKFANFNPADVLYKLALRQHCAINAIFSEEQQENAFKEICKNEAIDYEYSYREFLKMARAEKAKFSEALQQNFTDTHKLWIKDIGLGEFLRQ
ncbi:hypothetical protein HB364_14080 [Pseudoflavitalea sp. X16]|uniref:hypothetical protein n=1 Tax=Paraflavitalea devenefica TaxID=2716334 RepID=UPI00142105A8|nr:hypothetical protein [Paraflavitalea devenefica]NII26218.1 hypothetical protein [Paraflavitalea devenefica]